MFKLFSLYINEFEITNKTNLLIFNLFLIFVNFFFPSIFFPLHFPLNFSGTKHSLGG